jgi:hypothetical protein
MPQDSMKSDSRPRPPVPGWVKAFVVAGLILASLAVVMMVTGHGPGRHFGTTVDDPK